MTKNVLLLLFCTTSGSNGRNATMPLPMRSTFSVVPKLLKNRTGPASLYADMCVPSSRIFSPGKAKRGTPKVRGHRSVKGGRGEKKKRRHM